MKKAQSNKKKTGTYAGSRLNLSELSAGSFGDPADQLQCSKNELYKTIAEIFYMIIRYTLCIFSTLVIGLYTAA
jgi:hypothetical protein